MIETDYPLQYRWVIDCLIQKQPYVIVKLGNIF